MSNKPSKNYERAINKLMEALDYLEGQYSGIPPCCVEEFVVKGKTYYEFSSTLDKSDKKRLEKYEYVPCNKCFFSKRKPAVLKHNGRSTQGSILAVLIEHLDAGKPLS